MGRTFFAAGGASAATSPSVMPKGSTLLIILCGSGIHQRIDEMNTFPKVDEEKARALHHILYADAQGYGCTYWQAVNYAWTVSARARCAVLGSYEKLEH